jgi:hypothetical protein
VVPHALPIKSTQYWATLDFDLPRKAFNRFTAVAGLLADVQPQATCCFAVEGDGHVLFESPPLREADPATRINVDVRDTRRLRLIVRTDGSTDKLAFPIWAWPTIENTIAEPEG